MPELRYIRSDSRCFHSHSFVYNRSSGVNDRYSFGIHRFSGVCNRYSFGIYRSSGIYDLTHEVFILTHVYTTGAPVYTIVTHILYILAPVQTTGANDVDKLPDSGWTRLATGQTESRREYSCREDFGRSLKPVNLAHRSLCRFRNLNVEACQRRLENIKTKIIGHLMRKISEKA